MPAPILGGMRQKKCITQDDYFCLVPVSLRAKFEFKYIEIGL